MSELMKKVEQLQQSLLTSEKERKDLKKALDEHTQNCIKNVSASVAKISVSVADATNIGANNSASVTFANASITSSLKTCGSHSGVTFADAMGTNSFLNATNGNAFQTCAPIADTYATYLNNNTGLCSGRNDSSDWNNQRQPTNFMPQPSNVPPQWSYLPLHMATAYEHPPQSYTARPALHKRIDLPEFSGSPEAWPMFSVAYYETTARCLYTELENLMRLQKALKGEARTKVESLLIHPAKINSVMETLKFHYGRPELLVRSQIAKARVFPTIAANKMGEIVQFSTLVTNLTSFLENAGAIPHLQNPTLLDELVSKLPPSKREDWHRYIYNLKQPYPSVRTFCDWLTDLAKFVALSTDATQMKSAEHAEQKSKISKAVCVVSKENKKCCICEENHELYQCKQFREKTNDERWTIVKQHSLCFSCLQRGHNLQSCRRRRECGINSCHKPHNRLLHQAAVIDKKNNPTATHIVSTTCQNKASVNDKINSKTLLKYLPVKLYGPKGSMEIMAFIDEGAEITLEVFVIEMDR